MFKKIVVIALIGIGILGLGFMAAKAQQVYLGMYWIAGGVSDPNNVGTEGRKVVFYKDDPANGFADDIVGIAGLAGRSAEYALNAFEDYRLPITPGTYKAAIVKGEDNYGADPVEVIVTGNGYDLASTNLVLMFGAGIGDPGSRLSDLAPKFTDIRFGKRLYQRELVAKGQEFIVSAQPRISAIAVSSAGLDTSKISMVVNEGTANAKTYAISQAKVTAAGPTAAPTEVSMIYDLYNLGETLPEGKQDIRFKASNAYGSTLEICSVTVVGGEPRIVGTPITYPSPLHLKADSSVYFQYTLSADINVDIFLFDVSGRVAKKFILYARDEGGSAGVNKVTWNLITDQGAKVASGIYVFSLVNRDTGKMLGKGKFTALP